MEQTQENIFPTMEVKSMTKPFWFLVRMKSNIENIEENGLHYERFTESIINIEFGNLEEAQMYFGNLDNESSIKFTILYDYSKN